MSVSTKPRTAKAVEPSPPDTVDTVELVDPVEAPEVQPSEALDYEPPADPQPAEDVERLLPSPGEPFALSDGTMVVANELRLKEFLGLLKIVTRGAAVALGEVRLDATDEAFSQSLISLFLFAIPEAEEEAADFLRLMVRPAGPFADRDARNSAESSLDLLMLNPDLEDLFTIIEIVINHEGKDLRRLGKRLGKALEFAQRTGQI
jgi:hypothetical protein